MSEDIATLPSLHCALIAGDADGKVTLGLVGKVTAACFVSASVVVIVCDGKTIGMVASKKGGQADESPAYDVCTASICPPAEAFRRHLWKKYHLVRHLNLKCRGGLMFPRPGSPQCSRHSRTEHAPRIGSALAEFEGVQAKEHHRHKLRALLGSGAREEIRPSTTGLVEGVHSLSSQANFLETYLAAVRKTKRFIHACSRNTLTGKAHELPHYEVLRQDHLRPATSDDTMAEKKRAGLFAKPL